MFCCGLKNQLSELSFLDQQWLCLFYYNNGIIDINIDNFILEFVDINLDSLDSRDTNKAIVFRGTNDDNVIRNNMIHDKGGNPGGTGPFMMHIVGAGASSDTLSILNNFIYNVVEGSNDNAAAILLNEWSGTVNVYNNTIYNIQSQGGSKIAIGIRSAHTSGSTSNIKNNPKTCSFLSRDEIHITQSL